MGRVGSSGDNAAMESFFSLLQKNVLDTHGLTDDRAILHAVAVSAVKELADHGVDQLQVELLLDMLDVARDRDNPNPEASGF